MHISILAVQLPPPRQNPCEESSDSEELGGTGLFQPHHNSYPSLGMGCLGPFTRTWDGITSALVPQIFTPA